MEDLPAVAAQRGRRPHVLPALLLCVLAAALPPAAARYHQHWPGNGPVNRVTLRVTYEVAAPDCFSRPVIKVNGQMGPSLTVRSGEVLELTVINDVPNDMPSVTHGISIHFHGFKMKGVPWYDGTAFVEVCPIAPGRVFTARFQVNEMPGTYFWHGHAGVDRADGLTGPLIVLPPQGAVLPVPPPQYDEERTLFLNDWWHTPAGALAMRLNRPFDAAKQTNDSGGFAWVNNPQALLINGKGYYGDCALGPAGSKTPIPCSVQNYWVPPGASAVQPWASQLNPGCAHENITVETGKTYLFRIINAAALAYQTVCFEGHDVTIVAADAVPVEPISASKFNGCIDVNSGQRYDVLLTANKPAGNYWISTHVQYRPGSPSGYAVLNYAEATKALPTSQPPQPGSIPPWTIAQEAQLVASAALKAAKGKTSSGGLAGLYQQAASDVPAPTLNLLLNITQPLMKQTGQIRWALNNVAGQKPNPCQPLLDLVYYDRKWIERNLVPPAAYNNPSFNASALGVQEGTSGRVDVFLTTPDNTSPPPLYPTAGTHLLPLKKGTVVDIVLQNLAANANNGDYRVPDGANRTAQEQHPFHLHGHHFWLLGSGSGIYSPAANAASLNTVNPPLRDTATLPQNGWVVLRFVADNPGMWVFHCHLVWHEYMGQLLVIAEAVDELPTRPRHLPECPRRCTYNAAPWLKSFVDQKFGASGFENPGSG